MKAILLAIFVLFDAYTFYAIYQVGYLGIIEGGFANPGSLQVLLDLVIACSLIAWWMVSDARATGRNPWPYLVITVFAGSLGPLLYLLLAGQRDAAIAREAVQRA
jgi:Protein of unknown function DUF2834